MRVEGEERLYELQAAVCQALANPWRLRLVEALGEGEATVSRLAERLGISRSRASQHLGILRERGLVEARRQGGHVFYRLTHPNIPYACRLMREVLLERLERAGELSRLGRGEPAGEG